MSQEKEGIEDVNNAETNNNGSAKEPAANTEGVEASADKPVSGASNGAGDGGDASPSADGNSESDDAVQIYRPDGIADHLVGTTDQDTIDRLLKAYKGSRDELAKGKNVPDDADGYTLDVPDDVKEKILRPDEDGNDPVLAKFKDIAHKHGLSQETFQDVITDLYAGVMEDVEGGGAENAEADDADWDYTSYGGAEKAKPLVDAVDVWLKASVDQGTLTEQEAHEAALMSKHGAGLSFVLKAREAFGEKPIPVDLGKAGVSSEVTEEQVNKRVKDPRYWRDKDPAFIQETTEMFQQLYKK